MSASTTWNGKDFGTLDEEVGLTVPPRSTVLSPTVTMVSPAGLGFMTSTILPFMLAFPQLLFGATADVPFNIKSTIVAVVGGSNGYLGNVQYSQDNTIIKVTVGGKAPAGALPPALQPPTTTNTTETLPTSATSGVPTATSEVPTTTVVETTASHATTARSSSPTASPTAAVANMLTKRQMQILQEVPASQDPAVVEAWLKAVVNKLALDDGVSAPFI
ncbi:hypothetical protein BGZ52_010253 [Haplosporangium bisporale]|nr:hypothetical protein BGZ52_010253 [Haplosporangium bisporale]